MPYLIIDKQFIYISDARSHLLDEFLCKEKDKDYMWIMSSKIESFRGTNNKQIERERLVNNYLEQKHKDNPNNFYLNWVWFDIRGIDAKEEIGYLLDIYCAFYSHSFLTKTNGNIAAFHYYEDRGCKQFIINYNINPGWWLKFVSIITNRDVKISNGSIKVFINSNHVSRIVGTMQKFIVYSKDFNLVCGENFEIFPSGHSVISQIEIEEYNRRLMNDKYNIDNCSKNR